ncbi:RagB/SusD family nutrient uptake outer membrane protein [Zobellia sp. OII3]|uniref:RagB/SusD family nutrient uptake outer membrane protein n=1 Tax=Zobellia sp. OII3 TaxID=2034520 RepID=UPI000B532FC6|nr:RagB/SusD family nutrient uptake outer membrane protein [Zobellia sp. OII3]OWW27044.1 RagB/SusD family nutrient uptake outer membrane protein [Zobellia sp. OII3]
MITIKQFKIIAVIALLIPFGCSDEILDQTNPNEIAVQGFWRNAEDAKLAVNGMYHPITGTFFWGRIVHVGALLRTDAINPIPSGGNTSLSTFQGSPGVARWAQEPWEEAYKSIFRANSILENVNEENVPSTSERNEILGQAHFFRAFVYFYMVNMYGNIPLVDKTPDPKNDEELFPSQASPQAVWDLIIADLQQAESLLPKSWSEEDLGRPTSWAATALKGKSHLYRSGLLNTDEYALAEAAFKEVVNNGPYNLLPSEQYQENFTQTNENNSESVFELQYHPIGNGNFVWGQDIPRAGTQGNFVIEYAPPSQTPDNGHVINPWVKKVFETNNDEIRRNATLAYDYPNSVVNVDIPFSEGLATDIETVNSLLDQPQNTGLEPIFSRKYSGLELPVGATGFLGDDYGPNWRIIRYSDVLLMLAEAINEQNRPSEAEPFLNQVRTRAQITPVSGLNQENMRQAIIDERVMELTGEGHRFFDLVRWNLAETYLGTNSAHEGPHPKSIAGGAFQSGKHELIFIPQSELQSNPNLVQNQGY